MEFKKNKIIIDANTEEGLMIAIESFIYECSENIIPKNCDREQLVQNLEKFLNDNNLRKEWIEKSLSTKKSSNSSSKKDCYKKKVFIKGVKSEVNVPDSLLE